MSFTYTLTKADKLGSFDETYGQIYWCESKEELKPLKFNSKSQDIAVGDVITCEESLNKRSTKGVDYLQLRKIQVERKGAPAASKDAQANNIMRVLARIEAKVDQLLGIDDSIAQEAKAAGTGRNSEAWNNARDKLGRGNPPVDDYGNADYDNDEMPADFLS